MTRTLCVSGRSAAAAAPRLVTFPPAVPSSIQILTFQYEHLQLSAQLLPSTWPLSHWMLSGLSTCCCHVPPASTAQNRFGSSRCHGAPTARTH